MIYVFSGYELDTDRYELRLAGAPLRIEPKVFDLLAYLLQHPGHFVSREDLHERLWPDQYVTDSALTYCITAARKAVGDNGRAQRIIKTVHGRGYCFIAPVQERPGGVSGVTVPTTPEPLARAEASSPERADTAPSSIPVQTESSVSPTPEEATGGLSSSHGSVTPEAERRQLTVMWCRLVASPALSEHPDPEELHQVMLEAQRVCSTVVQRFEGHIAQHFGHGFTAYFGYPQAHEDDARRAVCAGLEFVQEMERLNEGLAQESEVQLAVRVGIHTGIVVMGEVGSGVKREQVALGDTPHITAQLSGLAEPHMVVISPATLELIEGYFVWRSMGSYLLEELSQPIAVYQVLQESEAQSRLDIAVKTGLTLFVGREQEAELLLERWEQVREGMGQVVLLSGEAGIGKSRLVHVCQERMIGGTLARLESRCSPYYQHSALYPIRDCVQRLLRWGREDSPQVKLSKLEETLRPYNLALEEVVPLLASLLSLPLPDRYPPLTLTPPRQKQKTSEALLAWLLRQAELQPVCLVMEDLQWSDPSTLELLSLLIDQIPTARMLILLTLRPSFHPPWGVRSYITHIALGRLAPAQVERMITSVTGGKALPAEVMQQLVVKSDGVPLFVEEMTRMVLESGLVKEREGNYELIEPLPSLAIPSTLHDSLMARLDRLGTGKQVAQLAATLGREFSYELIQAVATMDEADLQRELGQLVEAELLYQRGLSPQAQYLFKHVLIQEMAYQSLLRSTRQQYHKLTAQAFEERFPELRETQPELLAHHYTEANCPERAVSYWRQAGQHAVERSANIEATNHLTQGLKVLATLPDTPERARQELELQLALGVPLTEIQGFGAPDVEHAYRRAWELCQQMGETPELFWVLRGLLGCHLMRAEHQKVRELAEQLLPLAQRAKDQTLLLESHQLLGVTRFFHGEIVPAHEHFEQSIALYDPQHPLPYAFFSHGANPGVSCLSYGAWILWLLGYPDQALRQIHETSALTQALSHPFSRAFFLTLAAFVHQYRREAKAAQEQAEIAIALSNEHGFPFWLALGTSLRGWALAELGQREEGMAQMRQGMATYQAMGTDLVRPCFLALLAEMCGTVGQTEEGLRVLDEALAVVSKTGERVYEAELHRLRGELLLALSANNHAEAETYFHQALDVARRQSAKSWELRAAMSLSRLWQQQGKREQARHLLGETYGWFTEGLDTVDLKQAKSLLDAL